MFDAMTLIAKIEDIEKICQEQCFCKPGMSVQEKLAKLEKILQIILSIEDGSSVERLRNEYERKEISVFALSEILYDLEIAGSSVRRVIENALMEWNYRDYLIFLGEMSKLEDIYSRYEKLNSSIAVNRSVHEYVRKMVRGIGAEARNCPFKGKGAVYTVITGGKDNLVNPEIVNENWDYYCFTDSHELKSDFWKIMYIDDDMGLDQIRLQRYYKIFMYKVLKDYDYSIYIDGKNQIVGDLDEYIRFYAMNSSMLCFPHPLRKNMEEEITEVGKLNKADPDFLREQYQHYLSLGYDESVPIIESCCLVRDHHDPVLQAVMNGWFKEICEWSYRDQISLGYVCWKNNYRFDLSELVIYDNPYIKEIGHHLKYRTVMR